MMKVEIYITIAHVLCGRQETVKENFWHWGCVTFNKLETEKHGRSKKIPRNNLLEGCRQRSIP